VPPGPLPNGYAIFVLHPPPLFQGKLAVIEISAISDDTFSGERIAPSSDVVAQRR
jgi:hypothetical protein